MSYYDIGNSIFTTEGLLAVNIKLTEPNYYIELVYTSNSTKITGTHSYLTQIYDSIKDLLAAQTLR